MKRSLVKSSAVLFAVAALGGCSDSTSPSDLDGSYTAISFITTGTSGQTNQLLAGSSLDITLDSDGTTSGQLHMAASGGNPAFDASMGGTWRQRDDVVTFTQIADTFVRNMEFRIERVGLNEIYLVGDDSFSDTRIQLTLAREP